MSPRVPTPGRRPPIPPEVVAHLDKFLSSGSSRLIVIRSPEPEAGSRFLTEVVRKQPGPGVIVSAPKDPAAVWMVDLAPVRPELLWRVLPNRAELSSIAVASAAMRLVHSLLWEVGSESAVPPLWLPPFLFEAYSLLPTDPMPNIGVDNWDELLQEYLKDRPPAPSNIPSEEDLERILLGALEGPLRVHLLVVTRRPRVVLESGADLVLELRGNLTDPSRLEKVRVIRERGS
jgi:hypothetical protein